MMTYNDLPDALLKECKRPDDLLGDAGLMNGLRNRGVEDILIAVVDGLKGFPEAIPPPSRKPWSRPASCI